MSDGVPWQTPTELRELLCELVGWDSVTGTTGELRFAERLAAKLLAIDAFRGSPRLVSLDAVEGGQHLVTATYRHPTASRTIVLISHFDTVDIADYGSLRHLACDPVRLTAAFEQVRDELDPDAQDDLDSGEYLFGRGTMDMKMGLALHMGLLARAAAGSWPINLVLLAVPDEEVNSAGMRGAVAKLLELREEHELEYVLFLDGEPTFPRHPRDTNQYLYTGSIGKIMPSALFYGRETHAGAPLAGITSTYMASFLTQAMEWSDAFRETVHGESTPLPVTLAQRDLREGYSTQTPYRTTALYNVFTMERTAEQVMSTFETIARAAADRCTGAWHAVCQREGVAPPERIRVLRYDELLWHAVQKRGQAAVDQLVAEAQAERPDELRDAAMHVVDRLLGACQELTPAVVLLFAPPHYPPVSSSGDGLVTACVEHVRRVAHERFGLTLEQAHWCNGITDLSYVNYRDRSAGWRTYADNTPGYGSTYRIPFEGMAQLDAPVMNLGPFGKDPHQRTERLHMRSACEELPVLLEELVRSIAER